MEEAEGFSLFTSFIVSLNRNRSALVCEFTELLCNHSLFVDQLYENKSLALRTRDLFLFTNDIKNSELLHNNSLLELIYFLNADSSEPWLGQI